MSVMSRTESGEKGIGEDGEGEGERGGGERDLDTTKNIMMAVSKSKRQQSLRTEFAVADGGCESKRHWSVPAVDRMKHACTLVNITCRQCLSISSFWVRALHTLPSGCH